MFNLDELVDTSGDEMTEKKKRLLSRVLAPSKKMRHCSAEMVDDIGVLWCPIYTLKVYLLFLQILRMKAS